MDYYDLNKYNSTTPTKGITMTMTTTIHGDFWSTTSTTEPPEVKHERSENRSNDTRRRMV